MSLEIDVENQLRRLTPLEKAVLKARFSVPTDAGHSRSIGELPRSPAQLRRIERRALRKLRDDGTAHGQDGPPSRPTGIDVKGTELLNMAAFKLRDCAQRMLRLADVAPSKALGAKFLSIHRQLLQQEGHLQAAQHAAAPVRTSPKSSAGVPSTY